MSDSRSYLDAEHRCSLSRAVDLDLDSLNGAERAELEYEARTEGWIEGSLTVKSLRNTRTITPMPNEIRNRITKIRVDAGHSFDQGNDDLRMVAAYAWHVNMSEFDVWPMYSSLYVPFEDRSLDMNDPTEFQYGEFIYDTWLNVYELERYFYNWCLRMSYWIHAGIDAGRWSVKDGDDYTSAQEAAMFVGGEPMPKRFVEKIEEPTDWIRKDIKGGAASWQWPYSWLVFSVGEGENAQEVRVSEMDVARHCFSWTELLMRFEELGSVRRRALRFNEEGGSVDMTRDERSCANHLAFRVEKFAHRFGLWYSYAKGMWIREGGSERKFLLV